MKWLVAPILMLAIQPALADLTDEQACAKAKPQYSNEGMTEKDCLCILSVASKHMSAELKSAFVSALLAQEKNPMSRMMASGVSMEEMMISMAAYAAAVGPACGVEP